MWFILWPSCPFCHGRNLLYGEVDLLLSDADAQRSYSSKFRFTVPVTAEIKILVSLLLWKIRLQGERAPYAGTSTASARSKGTEICVLGTLSLSTMGIVLDRSALRLTQDLLVSMAYNWSATLPTII